MNTESPIYQSALQAVSDMHEAGLTLQNDIVWIADPEDTLQPLITAKTKARQ